MDLQVKIAKCCSLCPLILLTLTWKWNWSRQALSVCDDRFSSWQHFSLTLWLEVIRNIVTVTVTGQGNYTVYTPVLLRCLPHVHDVLILTIKHPIKPQRLHERTFLQLVSEMSEVSHVKLYSRESLPVCLWQSARFHFASRLLEPLLLVDDDLSFSVALPVISLKVHANKQEEYTRTAVWQCLGLMLALCEILRGAWWAFCYFEQLLDLDSEAWCKWEYKMWLYCSLFTINLSEGAVNTYTSSPFNLHKSAHICSTLTRIIQFWDSPNKKRQSCSWVYSLLRIVWAIFVSYKHRRDTEAENEMTILSQRQETIQQRDLVLALRYPCCTHKAFSAGGK